MNLQKAIQKLKVFIEFYRKAKTIYRIHSPFAYDFITDVIQSTKEFYAFNIIEAKRQKLLSDQNTINYQELGAGSNSNSFVDYKRIVSEIAKNALAPKSQAKILFYLINKYKRSNALEIGTSLGITASYLMSARPSMKLVTLEGNAEVLKIANDIFEKHQFENIISVLGNFDDTLPSVLNENVPFDFIYIDGNHSYEATQRYFKMILPHTTEDAIFVLDDIHWSEGMYKAWQNILKHPNIKTSIEVYDLGFVFMDKNLPAQNVTYLPFWAKPWQIGLFT